MSQSQYTYNTYQATAQPQIYNQNPNQDAAYTQQQAFPAAQFQYSIPQDTVMMPMNPYQSLNPNTVITVNQNQAANINTNKNNVETSDEKDIQNIMPNKQANPKLPKQKQAKISKANIKNENITINPTKLKVNSKNSPKPTDKKKANEDSKNKLSMISTSLPEDVLDLERNSGVPEFIKKLYRLLEDQSYKNIISWGDNGDSFVVKDATEFSRNVLPKHFKHNNFASFVRQLNKYDFHKVKVDKINSFGENIWEFKHPHFQFNKKEQLELIKRKVSNKNPKLPEQKPVIQSTDIQQQVNSLIEVGSALATNLDQLTSTYNDFSDNYINFGKYMELQAKTLKSLVDFVIDKEIRKQPNPTKNSNNFETLINNYNYWNSNSQVIQESFAKFKTNVNKNIEKMNNTREKINTLNETLKKSIVSVKYNVDSKYSMNPDDMVAIENILKSNKDKNHSNNKAATTNNVSPTTTTEVTLPTTENNSNYVPMNTDNTIINNSTTDPLSNTYNTKATMNLDANSTTIPAQIKTSPPTRSISLPLRNSDLKATTSLVKSVKKPKC